MVGLLLRFKKNSKKTSSETFVETKTKDNIVEQILTLPIVVGNGGKSLNMSTLVSNSAWIIDSSATDHMTFDSR